MNRRIIGIVAAVVLAAMGTFVLVAFVKGAESRALAGERIAAVLVAQEDVPKGTPAEALGAKVRLEQVPAKVRASGAVEDLAALKGKVASVDLVAGEQLMAARFLEPAAVAAQGDTQIPEGLQEVTIALEAERAAGGSLTPGSTAGVFMSFEPFEVQDEVLEQGATAAKTSNTTHLQLHKVLVTKVQSDPTAAQPAPAPANPQAKGDQPQSAPGGRLFVTLALDAPDAERLVFAAEHGTIWLSNEPETATEDGTSIIDRGTIHDD